MLLSELESLPGYTRIGEYRMCCWILIFFLKQTVRSNGNANANVGRFTGFVLTIIQLTMEFILRHIRICPLCDFVWKMMID
jgi:hypothetical protein